MTASPFPKHQKSTLKDCNKFSEANLKINPTKCAFFQTKVQFLGHVVSKNGWEADPEKVKALQNFPVPQNQTEPPPPVIEVKEFRY